MRRLAPVLMIQGTTSWAGKSLVTTALCRWFAQRGVDVAPFKAQNMSNNARVVDGGEIGAAQHLQALAARATPHVRMNPVLLKPETHTASQVVVNGLVDEEMSRAEWRGRSETLWPVVQQALADLRARHELVIAEGAGSPAEINLAASDIVNMRVAREADAAVLLVTDIDRGGAFAHLYGTWAMVEPEDRHRIKGFVLNRFRGDAALLAPGPEMLRDRTGVPTVGVLPWFAHALPDEDGGGHRERRGSAADGARPAVAVVLYPTASNLDEYRVLEQDVDLVWARTPRDLRGADLVVLPGSKHVRGDLAWLRATGLANAIRQRVDDGGLVLGVCGGLQMLGARIDDPHDVERAGGGAVAGLGALDLVTTFHPQKRASSTTATFRIGSGPWAALDGCSVSGYEIRHGHTRHGTGAAVEVLGPDLGWAHGPVLGVYLHGVLESRSVLDRLFGERERPSLDATFDHLADQVDRFLDMTAIAAMVQH